MNKTIFHLIESMNKIVFHLTESMNKIVFLLIELMNKVNKMNKIGFHLIESTKIVQEVVWKVFLLVFSGLKSFFITINEPTNLLCFLTFPKSLQHNIKSNFRSWFLSWIFIVLSSEHHLK